MTFSPAQHYFLYVLLFAAAVVAIAIPLARLQTRRRTREMQTAAREIGFTFEGADWIDLMQSPQLDSILFVKGAGGRWSNVMTGTVSGLKTSIFDYSCGIARSRRGGYTQTVVAFSQEMQLPMFAVCPNTASDPIRGPSHYHEMDFDFSNRYVLRGPDEEKMRELLTPALTSTLLSFTPEDGWHIEGMGTTLVLYRMGATVRTAEFPAFLQQTSLIARTFFDLCGPKKPVA